MLKRVGIRLGLILLVTDVGLTALALHLAKALRLTLPLGVSLTQPLAFGPWFYLLVPAIWALVFLALRVYDPARALRYLGDVQSVWSAVTWATLVFAGVAYLFFREFSRLLFVYFYLLDLVFLLSWRAILQGLLRLGVGRSLGEPRRVLVVGAGAVGQELSRALRAYHWAGLELVGYVDDDEAKQGKTCAGHPVLGALGTSVRSSSNARLTRSSWPCRRARRNKPGKSSWTCKHCRSTYASCPTYSTWSSSGPRWRNSPASRSSACASQPSKAPTAS